MYARPGRFEPCRLHDKKALHQLVDLVAIFMINILFQINQWSWKQYSSSLQAPGSSHLLSRKS